MVVSYQNMFGFSTEAMDLLLMPMGVGGQEALGSMGNDAPLAVLSHMPRPPSDYFKQLFAQVGVLSRSAVPYYRCVDACMLLVVSRVLTGSRQEAVKATICSVYARV